MVNSAADDGVKKPEDPVEICRCIVEIEKESRQSDMNIERLVNLYKTEYPGEAVWKLVQDINRQITVYHNIIEELKREAPTPVPTDFEQYLEDRAKFVKEKYEKLKLLPENELPNPFFDWTLDTAFKKIANYSKGLVKIARSFAFELLAELNVEVATTATVQVALAVPPSLTIGFEKSLAIGVALGAAAGPGRP